jgi:hypothetical protein
VTHPSTETFSLFEIQRGWGPNDRRSVKNNLFWGDFRARIFRSSTGSTGPRHATNCRKTVRRVGKTTDCSEIRRCSVEGASNVFRGHLLRFCGSHYTSTPFLRVVRGSETVPRTWPCGFVETSPLIPDHRIVPHSSQLLVAKDLCPNDFSSPDGPTSSWPSSGS